MRALILFIFTISAPVAFAEYCNWGFVPPKRISCDGETYIYGTAACESQIYQNIFCHERFSNSGRDCAEDNSKSTLKCYQKMVAPRPQPEEAEGFCNWGFAGAQRFKCGGETFVYGTAACQNKIYWNVFCKEDFSRSGNACEKDNSKRTISCYNELVKAGKIENRRGGTGRQEQKSGVQ